MTFVEEIAGIIKESRPGCNQKKECNTECGKCGAARVMDLLSWLHFTSPAELEASLLIDFLNRKDKVFDEFEEEKK